MLLEHNFDIVLADPPWWYTKFGTAKLPYEPMTEEALMEFPIGDLMRPRYGPGKRKGAWLFVWLTCPHILGMQARILFHWCAKYGLHYRGIPFVWVKTKKSDPQAPIGGTGPRATITKPGVEFVAAFSNCKTGRPVPMIDEKQVQIIDDQFEATDIRCPRDGHSRKPPEVIDRIDTMYGGTPARVELFARGEARKGWSGWGDQCENAIPWI